MPQKQVKTVQERVLSSEEKDVRKWVQKDLESAAALLNMVRMDPELMDMVAERIWEKTKAAQEQTKAELKNKED